MDRSSQSSAASVVEVCLMLSSFCVGIARNHKRQPCSCRCFCVCHSRQGICCSHSQKERTRREQGHLCPWSAATLKDGFSRGHLLLAKKGPAPEGALFQHSLPGHECPGSLRREDVHPRMKIASMEKAGHKAAFSNIHRLGDIRQEAALLLPLLFCLSFLQLNLRGPRVMYAESSLSQLLDSVAIAAEIRKPAMKRENHTLARFPYRPPRLWTFDFCLISASDPRSITPPVLR